jgi:hypothetical protein
MPRRSVRPLARGNMWRNRLVVGIASVMVASTLQAQGPVTNWHIQSLPGNNMQSVWASAPNDVFVAGGTNSINHFDGSTWTAQPNSFGINRYKLFGIAANDLYVTGQNAYQTGALGHYDGTAWSQVLTTSDELTAGYQFSPSSLFVGGDGTLREYDGTSWTDIPTGLSQAFNTDRLTDIWGTSASDFFVAGYHGIFMHYDGTALTQLSLGDNVVLHAVRGTSGNDIFAVGDNGAIWHDDGTSWSSMVSGTSYRLTSVYTIAPNDVYAAGDKGTMLHYDGSTWTSVNVGTSDDITDVWGISANRVYASAGHEGEVLIGEGAQVVTPEPASLLLISTGVAGVLALTRKRRICRWS